MKSPLAIRAQYPRTAALAALLVALALGACGDDEDDNAETTAAAAPQQLTPAEAKVITGAERAVGDYCAKVARSVSAGGGAPPAEDFELVNEALARLGDLAAEKPNAAGPGGESPELALGDILENLEGSNCDNRLVTILEAELAEVPSE